jgi:hypothetical protein
MSFTSSGFEPLTFWLVPIVYVGVEVILRPAVSRPVCLRVGHPYRACDQFFIIVGHLHVSCCGAPSLTRIQVSNLLVQFAASFRFKSRRTHYHILLSHLRLPQRGGLGSRIYIPQEQGGSVIPPDTGFPFCRLLRLAGLRWRYSSPPPHGGMKGTTIVWDITPCSLAVMP